MAITVEVRNCRWFDWSFDKQLPHQQVSARRRKLELNSAISWVDAFDDQLFQFTSCSQITHSDIGNSEYPWKIVEGRHMAGLNIGSLRQRSPAIYSNTGG